MARDAMAQIETGRDVLKTDPPWRSLFQNHAGDCSIVVRFH
jgi:hypothetical protein